VLGVLVAALLVTALVVTGRSQDRMGRPPSPAADRLGFAVPCPGLLPIPARRPTGAVDLACESERRIATITVQGTRAVLVGCPGWSTSGQMTLRWTQAGTRISVSLQGTSTVNHALLTALATHLRLLRPAATVRLARP
jgi:hypothetical protein